MRRFWRFWSFCSWKELWRVERDCLGPLHFVMQCSGCHWEPLEIDLWLFFLALFEASPCVGGQDSLLLELGLSRDSSSLSKTSYSSANHLHMVLGVSFVSFESWIVVVLVRKGERSKLACNNRIWLSLTYEHPFRINQRRTVLVLKEVSLAILELNFFVTKGIFPK